MYVRSWVVVHYKLEYFGKYEMYNININDQYKIISA